MFCDGLSGFGDDQFDSKWIQSVPTEKTPKIKVQIKIQVIGDHRKR